MSTTTRTTRRCSKPDCIETGEKWEFYKEYCSKQHYFEHTGREALDSLKYDHRICGSCYRVRAVVSPPRHHSEWYLEEPKDGTFTLNPEEDTVDFETFGQEESYEAAIGRRYPTPNEDESGACLCGTIRTTEEHDILRPIELDKVLARLFKRLCEKERDGEIDDRPDKRTFLESFRDSRCLEYAVGKSLHS